MIMAYIKIETKEVVTAAQIMAANPGIDFPDGEWSDEMLVEYGYAILYHPNTDLFPNRYERLEKLEPQLIDGKWTIVYALRSIVPEVPEAFAIFLENEKNKLKDQVANIRWQMETGGVLLEDGTLIHTDRESQSKLAEAMVLSQFSQNMSLRWKCSGKWIAVDRDMLIALSIKVGDWVQKCFSNESIHWDRIDALKTTDDLIGYRVDALWRD
jgi:hypothetical protein